MPNIGPMEIVLLAVLAAVIFGPAKFPEMARSLGRHTREFKDSIDGTGIGDAFDGVNDVRTAVKPSNIAKAAMPASVKEMSAGVTEMKDTFTDPLGQKKKDADDAEATDEDAVADPMPATRAMPVAAAAAPAVAPEHDAPAE